MAAESVFSLFETPNAIWHLYGAAQHARVEEASSLMEQLVMSSREARGRAYAPYSGFRVGAALRMDGEPFSGSNIENASYGATLCAERVALAAAVDEGHRHLELLAVSTSAEPNTPPGLRSPCGICRQVASEFASDETLVILDAGTASDGRLQAEVATFDWLLPWRFNLGH